VTATLLVPVTRGQTLSTEVAERREVMLEDGSTVRLEPDTTLRVKMDAQERRIWVESGRALFHVAKDQRRPFRVAVDGTHIRALGTTFGVEHRNASVVVTVSEGKVGVQQPGGAQGGTPAPAREVLLTAGQQLVTRNSGAATSVQQVDTARALAWSEGRLVFDATPLSEVVSEFNRYNHVKLQVADRELGRRPVSGVFQASDPQTLIAFIRAGARVHVTSTTDGSRILIVPLPSGQ
jgi:transmembrane sensor